MEAEAESGKFLWKQKQEAVKEYRFRFHFGHSIKPQKLDMWCKFLRNMRQKVNILSNIIRKETFLKACGALRSGAAPTPTNLKMNYVANQIIFWIIGVQKCFI